MERKIFPFGFKINSPQFSAFKEDLGSQILFTSKKGFSIYLRHHFMKYDLFNQDPKNIICLNCEDMTVYSAPPRIDFDRKIFWIENNQRPVYSAGNEACFSGGPFFQSSEQTAQLHRHAKENQINVQLT